MGIFRTLTSGSLGIIWMLAGPITYIISVVDTWGGRASVVVKILISLTLDAVLSVIWPITWILWIISHLSGGNTPISTVLGL